jgi:hypothetical protein
MFLEWVKYSHETWKPYLTPVIITSVFSSSLSQNSRSFANFYVRVLVQCVHKYRTSPCVLSFVNCFVLCFWNILFYYTGNIFLTKHFFGSYVLSWLRRFFFEPDFCVFSEVMFIFIESYVTCFMIVFYDFWNFFLVRTVFFRVIRKAYFTV